VLGFCGFQRGLALNRPDRTISSPSKDKQKYLSRHCRLPFQQGKSIWECRVYERPLLSSKNSGNTIGGRKNLTANSGRSGQKNQSAADTTDQHIGVRFHGAAKSTTYAIRQPQKSVRVERTSTFGFALSHVRSRSNHLFQIIAWACLRTGLGSAKSAMPDRITGLRSGNSTTRDNCPPIAFT